MKNFLYIGFAAAMGAWSRWGIGILLNTLHPIYPMGTLTVNLAGAYLMGISMGAFELFSDLSPDLKLIINIGFLGGLTTFSAFTAEIFQLLQKNELVASLTLIALHVVGSVLMAYLGWLSVSFIKQSI
ncbi:fluoride efflux transporter CrcB [Candidatus Methylopumilus universalis]|nr:fluoride efflux transporter CrcB [Candidatus Methylopumilus universalis]MBP6152232.1 fluoride efflux transporter CrcB [Candidatus Methylopumilus sp.]MBP7855670.1 fluoride efflux transporter CrcB [Candidatus Methylopumilus sp.]GDX53866.1 putative fluoride ion transporter CrcB [Methylophilaceae bacterium]